MNEQTETAEARIKRVTAELLITMSAIFVPWSQSRNKDEKRPSLNWRVTLSRCGREFLTTDYMAGSGHAPSYKRAQKSRLVRDDELVKWECEHGVRGFRGPSTDTIMRGAGPKPIMPNTADVISSLVSDSSAIDHATFESWAGDFGYDIDSRKAEAIYRACLDIALKLRNGVGEDGLAKLREACQDY